MPLGPEAKSPPTAVGSESTVTGTSSQSRTSCRNSLLSRTLPVNNPGSQEPPPDIRFRAASRNALSTSSGCVNKSRIMSIIGSCGTGIALATLCSHPTRLPTSARVLSLPSIQILTTEARMCCVSAIQFTNFLLARRDSKTFSARSTFLWSKYVNNVNPETYLDIAW